MQTITIDGQELRYDGLTEDRRGIRAGGKVFWMFPAVRWPEGELEPLLPIGPRVVRRVTTQVPDRTTQHPETVKELFDKRLAYHSTITQAEHNKQYPDDAWISPEQFEESRQRIVAETLEEFTRTLRARDYVWAKHGTPELAEKLGFIDRQARLGLYSRFRAAGHGERSAWQQVHRVRWAAYYSDPKKTNLYLYDLIEEPDLKMAELELKRREIEAQEKVTAAAEALAEAQRTHSELGEVVVRSLTEFRAAQAAANAVAANEWAAIKADTGAALAEARGTRSKVEEMAKLAQARQQGAAASYERARVASGSRYRMRFAGAKKWEIEFGKRPVFFVADNGIGRELAYVLKHPYTPLHVLDVHSALSASAGAMPEAEAHESGLTPQSGTHRIEGVRLTAKKAREAEELLAEQLASARQAGDTEGAQEAEEGLERLRKYQANARHGETDEAKRCNDRMRLGIKRFKEALATERTPGGKAFLKHLNEHLSHSRCKLYYQPPEGLLWSH